MALRQIDGLGALAVAPVQTARERGIERARLGNLRQRLARACRQHEPQRFVRDVIHHGVGAVFGGDGHHAQLVIRQRGQLRGEAVNRAAVPHEPVPAEFRHAKADAEAGLVTRFGELRAPHFVQRFRFEDSSIRSAAMRE